MWEYQKKFHKYNFYRKYENALEDVVHPKEHILQFRHYWHLA